MGQLIKEWPLMCSHRQFPEIQICRRFFGTLPEGTSSHRQFPEIQICRRFFGTFPEGTNHLGHNLKALKLNTKAKFCHRKKFEYRNHEKI